MSLRLEIYGGRLVAFASSTVPGVRLVVVSFRIVSFCEKVAVYIYLQQTSYDNKSA